MVFFGAVVGGFAELVLAPVGEPFETVHLPIAAEAVLAGFFADNVVADGGGGVVVVCFHGLVELLDGGFLAFAAVGDLFYLVGVEGHGVFLCGMCSASVSGCLWGVRDRQPETRLGEAKIILCGCCRQPCQTRIGGSPNCR